MSLAIATRITQQSRISLRRPILGAAAIRQNRRLLTRTKKSEYRTTLNILFQCRSLSTETSTPRPGAQGPPPGFNLEEAKKPLPIEKNAKPTTEPKTALSAKLVKAAASKQDVTKKATREILQPSTDEKDLSTTSSSDGKEKKPETKLTIWQKVKKEAVHFWDGTKLLGAEIKISWKLALKMAAGYELTRREQRQLQRTVKDLGRLVPFSVFIIVPAGELFLPFALKFFPNLLPSTYEAEKVKEQKKMKLRETRKAVSDFLRSTLQETGLPITRATRQKEEFTEFFKKIRTTGQSPTREELIRVCKIFKDDLTLDNLSRPQLVAMCRYMNLSAFGTDAMLRYNIRHRMRHIKRDDRAISYEGVDSLNVSELQQACASRGIRTHGVSPVRLREDLSTWLELRLKHGVPSTLLVLSNAFMYAQGREGEIDSHYDALQAVLSSIPEELYHEIELEVSTAEGAATNKQRLEVLREQQELIEEEAEQSKEHKEAGGKQESVKDDRDIDEREGEKNISRSAEAVNAGENSKPPTKQKNET